MVPKKETATLSVAVLQVLVDSIRCALEINVDLGRFLLTDG
jgi:hypothetical protein